MTEKGSAKVFTIISIAGIVATVLFFVWGFKEGIFTSEEKLKGFISTAGVFGPLLFGIIQVVQVVIPVVPGGASCLVGVILFGAVRGFILNYVGICIGSMLAFLISRKFGRPILLMMFKEKQIEKYDKFTETKGRFWKIFAILIAAPVAPDDLLCYLAGTTTMSFRRFAAIIWICKVPTIISYSLILNFAWEWLLQLLQHMG